MDPAGTGIVGSTVTQGLDQDVPLQEIGRWHAEAMQNDTNGQIVTDTIQFDTKAMRKLRAGDEISLSYIASTGANLRLRGVVYLWFKE